ncbi:MAG TPA: sel1 repeat family protein [Victivallis vadensis]|nr:sel1 repeat family protein [Victivallis vadensis]
MKKLLGLVILLMLGFNGFSETPQTAREVLSRPVFPKVDYEEVELGTTLRHLLQRPECQELGLSYEIASDVKECRVTIKEQQVSLLKFLNLMCLQNQLQFSFKDNQLHFYNDTRQHSFSQTTTGNRNVDARLSQIIIPKLSVEEVDYFFLLQYLNNEAIKYSGTDKKEFIFTWKYDENHSDKYRINASFTNANLLTVIQNICKLGNLEFRYTDGILLFAPRETPSSPVASQPHKQVVAKSAGTRQSFQQGMSCYDKKEYTKAFQLFLEEAKKGDAEAEFWVGRCYDRGEGVQKNYQAALEWYTRSAEQGYFKAQHNLAILYYEGKGIKRDDGKAFHWAMKAAEQGDAKSQYAVARMYFSGEGVPVNFVEGKKWLIKATEQGNEEAIALLKKIDNIPNKSLVGASSVAQSMESLKEQAVCIEDMEFGKPVSSTFRDKYPPRKNHRVTGYDFSAFRYDVKDGRVVMLAKTFISPSAQTINHLLDVHETAYSTIIAYYEGKIGTGKIRPQRERKVNGTRSMMAGEKYAAALETGLDNDNNCYLTTMITEISALPPKNNR